MHNFSDTPVAAIVWFLAFLIMFALAARLSSERRSYHKQLCVEWLANAVTRVDSLQIFVDDRNCLNYSQEE